MSCSSCLELWSFCWILQDVHGRSQDTWAFDTEPFQQPLAAWVQSLNALSRPAYKKPTKEICQRLRLTFFICHQTWLAGKCPSPKWTCYLGGGFGGIPTPLKKYESMKDYPIYEMENKSHVWNHQAVMGKSSNSMVDFPAHASPHFSWWIVKCNVPWLTTMLKQQLPLYHLSFIDRMKSSH